MNNNIIQVLKFENNYYEINDIVKVSIQDGNYREVSGRIIEFNNYYGGIEGNQTLILDTSETYKQNEIMIWISRIIDMEKL